MIVKSNDEINILHKLLTDIQISKLRKAYASSLLANIKLSRTGLSKMVQLRGFLGRHSGTLLKNCLPLMENVLKPLAKRVLILLGLMAAASMKKWKMSWK